MSRAPLRLAVLGDPVEHSRSPAIHTAALRAAGIDGTYVARRVDDVGVAAACDEIRDGRLDGANVTMPHKGVAAAAADELDDLARRAGSVNTLARVGDAVVGFTTDVGGIQDAWARAGLPEDVPVLLLGAGGAAAAALLAVESKEIFVSARRSGAASNLASVLGVAVVEITWGSAVDGAVVVNATPLGMHREALPSGVVEASSGLCDMAYGSGTTPSISYARGRGLPFAEGLDMLVAQAARSFVLWTGIEPDVAVMRAAALA